MHLKIVSLWPLIVFLCCFASGLDSCRKMGVCFQEQKEAYELLLNQNRKRPFSPRSVTPGNSGTNEAWKLYSTERAGEAKTESDTNKFYSLPFTLISQLIMRLKLLYVCKSAPSACLRQ